MLADLFKPAWKSSSVEKRLKAIAEMDADNPDKQQILVHLATGDVESSVCVAAIQKITSIGVLHEMSLKHANSSVTEGAETRVNDLLSVSRSLNKDQYAELLNQFPELKLRIAAHADLPAVRTDAIQGLTTDQLLVVLAGTTFSDSRQLVAEKLDNIEDLESARKIVRGKDKNAERIVKAKIDEYRNQQRIHAENLAIVEKLIEEVEYLTTHDWIPEFKAKLQVHRNNWDNLGFTVDPESSQRYQAARQIIDKRSEEQLLIEQTHLSQQQLVGEVEAFMRELASRNLALSIKSVSETSNSLGQFNTNWKQLADTVRPNLVTYDRFENMLRALQSVIQLVQQSADILNTDSTVKTGEADPEKAGPEKTGPAAQTRIIKKLSENSQRLSSVLKKFKWPAPYGVLQVEVDLQAQLAEWRQALKTSAAERQQKLDNLHKKISSIFRFTRSGNLARAQQLCDRVEKGLKLFDGKDRVALEDRFEEARKTLGKMGDWKNFATEPKYIELCEAMELLVDSKKHPDKLSNDMKALQKQWTELGHSEISDEYWPRFKQAADKVYKPCAEFFDKRHKVRQTHLEQRQQFVEQMRELLETTDWDNDPDYKGAQSAVRSISDKYFDIKDVERNAGQKQWKQFCKFKDVVYARLDVAYEANLKLKQQLIEQAVVLAEADSNADNLVKLKALQARWKHIGITKRNQDQKAWKEFKKQGDMVYDKVQKLRQGLRDETDQQLNAYRDIIKQIQTLARSAQKLHEADQAFTALQADYDALPELPVTLPEKLIDGIQRDYGKACHQFDQCHSRLINNIHVQKIDALRQRANLCALQEALGESPSEQQLQELSLQWDAIELNDSMLSRRIEERRSSAQTSLDRDAIGEERRMFCIQLEIALGVDSPAEDKTLRMQYQLEQMNESGLGQHNINGHEQLEAMELDWLCMPGANSQQQKILDERFQHALRSAS